MSTLKRMLLLLFFMMLPAGANAYYFGGLDDYAAGVPSQEQKPSFLEQYGGQVFYETLYSGRFGTLDVENHTLILDSEVPGFLGPEGVSVPLAVSDEAAVNLCESGGECRSIGTEGWESLASIPQEELAGARVVVMGDREDPARIISIIKK